MTLRPLLKALVAAIVTGLLVPMSVFAAGATASPTGPKTATVGQTFRVTIMVNGAQDVDTIRMNGSFTSDLLEYKGASPAGVFQNVSPGTYFDQAKGIFSFGAFTLSSHANGNAATAVLTFRAKKAGDAYVQLTTNSRVLSAGEDQLTGTGRLNIKISDAPEKPEQPQSVSPVEVPGKLEISLKSSSHSDPNAWYANRNVAAEWVVQGKDVDKIYLGFDQAPEGPAETEKESTNTFFTATQDGVWYVHLKAVFKDRSIETADLRVQIDTQNPHTIVPITDQTEVFAGNPNALRFATLDDASGIDRYDVYLNDVLVTSTRATAYSLSSLASGAYRIRVVAYDRAGNNITGNTSVNLLSAEAAPTETAIWWHEMWPYLLLALLLLLIAIYAWWFWIMTKRKKKEKKR